MDIEIKRGDALALDITRVDASANPISLTGMTITSQAKISGFAANLTVTIVNAALGQIRLSATAAATAAWPIARLSCDVKYDAGGGSIVRSKTFTLKVVQEITT
jgi:uncharacterized membrane protein